MAESHVVSGLAAKRAELAGLIDHHRKEAVRIADALLHLDATLKLFAPEIDMRSIRAKTYMDRSAHFRPGEGQRAILDLLRTSGRPLTSRELADAVIAEREMENTPERFSSVQKSLLTSLKTLEQRNLVAVASTDKHGTRAWVIAP